MPLENKKLKEKRINELIIDCFTEEQFVDIYDYLTVKNKAGLRTTSNNLRNQYKNRNVAALIRRLDPMAYDQM